MPWGWISGQPCMLAGRRSCRSGWNGISGGGDSCRLRGRGLGRSGGLDREYPPAISASGLGRVRNVGLAFPGPFDYERGISLIQGVRKFDRLYGLDVTESLLARLEGAGVEECRYVNDAAAFALGECFCGAASGAGRVMALTLGTGFGSGFVAAGRLPDGCARSPRPWMGLPPAVRGRDCRRCLFHPLVLPSLSGADRPGGYRG